MYVFIAFAVLAVAAPARLSAHEDYEEVVTTLTSPDGQPFDVVQHWTDGIFFTDPVKLILRKPDGEVQAETEYRRNLVVTQTSDGRWIAFTAWPWNVFYHRAWWIESGELVPASDFAHIPLAFAAGVRQHWVAYTTSVSLLVAAFAGWRARRRQSVVWRRVSLVAIVCFWLPIAVLLGWAWVRAFEANANDGPFGAVVLTTIATMFAYFCFRVCRTSSSTLGLAAYFALMWMMLQTMYGSALPLSILLVAAVVSLVVYLLIEKAMNVCKLREVGALL